MRRGLIVSPIALHWCFSFMQCCESVSNIWNRFALLCRAESNFTFEDMEEGKDISEINNGEVTITKVTSTPVHPGHCQHLRLRLFHLQLSLLSVRQRHCLWTIHQSRSHHCLLNLPHQLCVTSTSELRRL